MTELKSTQKSSGNHAGRGKTPDLKLIDHREAYNILFSVESAQQHPDAVLAELPASYHPSSVGGMVIALSNSKGGVGKSTIAVHLAVWLAEQGRRVVLVDSDVQNSSSVWLKEAAPQIETIQLHTAEDVVAKLPEISANFEFVVADGPAGLSEVTRAILCLSDMALFPCGPSILDLRAVIEAVTDLKQIQQIWACTSVRFCPQVVWEFPKKRRLLGRLPPCQPRKCCPPKTRRLTGSRGRV